MKSIFKLILIAALATGFSCKRSTFSLSSKARSFQIVYLLGSVASITPKRQKTEENASLVAVEYLYRTKLKGDFDGDGVPEILHESMRSEVTGGQVDSVVYENFPGGFYDPYTGLVSAIIDLNPSLKLKSSNGLPDLKLNHTPQVFGILDIKNLGNVNNIPGDEFAIVVDWADWSSVNTCDIYTLHNKTWIRQFKFEIRDAYSDGDFCFSLIDEVLLQRTGNWYYLETRTTKNPGGWQKLNLDSLTSYE